MTYRPLTDLLLSSRLILTIRRPVAPEYLITGSITLPVGIQYGGAVEVKETVISQRSLKNTLWSIPILLRLETTININFLRTCWRYSHQKEMYSSIYRCLQHNSLFVY